MIRIQKRDQRAQALTYEQRFVKAKHLQKHEFLNCHPSEIYRRMQQLVEAGYLKAVTPYAGSRELVYVLTDKGVAEAKKHSPWDIEYSARLNPATLEHDTMVTMTRIRMCQMMGGRWIPEVVLRAKKPMLSVYGPEAAVGDGIFVRPDGVKIAVELENSVKSKDRYERIFSLWAARSDVDLVLYVATEPMFYQRLKARMEAQAKDLRGMDFALVDYAELFRPWPIGCWSPGGQRIFLDEKPFQAEGVENVAIQS